MRNPRPGVSRLGSLGGSALSGVYRCHMRAVDWLTILVAVATGILLPVLIMTASTGRRGGRIEQKLDDLTAAEADQDRRVAEVFAGLDRRLRWLEERFWGSDPRYPRGRGPR